MGSIKTLGAAIGVAFGVGAVVAFGKSAVQAASDVEEMSSKFAVVFKDLAGGVEQELGNFAQAANRSKYDLMGFAATMQDTFVPLGFARDEAAEMSVQVVKLAEDLGSFNNLPTADVVRDIQSALVGNTETVRKYGVVLTQQRIEEEARARGMWNGAGAIDAQTKAWVSLQLIMAGNSDAQGDAIRTADSFANRVRGLEASFKDLKVAIGNSIIPIINQVMPYIKAAVDALVVFFNTVAQIMNALFGTSISMASVEAEAAAEGMNNAAEAAGGAADAQGDLAKNTEKAGKAAKGALAAFDQLNVLQTQDTSADSALGGGGGGSVGGGIATPVLGGGGKDADAGDGALTALQEKVAAFKVAFLEFIQPVTDALGRLEESLRPLGETIWSGLKWAWDNILVPLGAWVITDLLPVFLDTLGGAAELLNSILLALQPAWDVFWEYVLQPLAEWTGGVIVEFLDSLADALKGLSDWINENNPVVQDLTVSLLAGAAAYKTIKLAVWALDSALWKSVTAWMAHTAALIADKAETIAIQALLAKDFLVQMGLSIAAVWRSVTAWVAETAAKTASTAATILANIQMGILTATTAIWNTVAAIAETVTWGFGAAMAFLASPIGLIILLIAALGVLIYLLITHWEELSTTVKQIGFLMGYYLAQAWESIKKSFFAALNAIQEKFAAVWTTIQQIWYLAGVWFASIGNEIQAAFDAAMEAMKQKASEIWAAVKLVWGTAGAWFTGVGNSIKKAFDSTLDSVKTKFETVFTGIKNFVQNIIESIKKFIGNMATSIEETIDGIIDGIGSVGDILPELPTTPTSSGAQSYSIPQLATGAVIPPNARFAAILGDQRNGMNIETPEALLRQIFREESGQGGGEITIRFEGTLGALVRELRPYIEQENTRFGKSLAIGAA